MVLGQGYFESLGFSVPMHANPADIFMDIVAGIQPRSKQSANASFPGSMSPPQALSAQHYAEVRCLLLLALSPTVILTNPKYMLDT